MSPPDRTAADFSTPAGEPALTAPDSVSWRVFANPVTVFMGGIAAVVLELAEPRVRTGVWEHTRFRDAPYSRLQRTGLAAMMTVYGPRSRSEAMIAGIVARHAQVRGTTPAGEPYHASDPALLRWVHATAAYGFLRAHEAYAHPLSDAERNAYYAEGARAAALYGAVDAPVSAAGLDALLEAMRPQLEPSPILDDFLRISRTMPAVPRWLRPMQALLVDAGVDLLPPWVHVQLRLGRNPIAAGVRRRMVCAMAGYVGGLSLPSHPAAQARRRLAADTAGGAAEGSSRRIAHLHDAFGADQPGGR